MNLRKKLGNGLRKIGNYMDNFWWGLIVGILMTIGCILLLI